MATDLAPRFGALLRAFRHAAGLTQEALAERAGLSVHGISNLERGVRQLPHPHTVRQLARALRLPAAERARLEAAGRRPAAAAVGRAPAPRPATNLPVQVTSFVGRAAELAEVRRLLATTRLLTLTGASGVGKTRLALQTAAALLDDYPDGVWLVELAALGDPALLPQAVALALGVRELAGQPLLATLLASLRARRLLLVLDNCEHLLDAGARLADAAIHAGPDLRVLATSREPLGIAGEVSWRVPSLPAPPPDERPAGGGAGALAAVRRHDAVRLFLDRAAAARPGFALTERNAPAVAEVCRRLDGIPLAIELAAARVRALPVEELATRLDDRFRLLTGGRRTALPRQQTLEAALAWSHDLLTEPERVLFRRLAVFAGGWTLAAAEAVCGEVAAQPGGRQEAPGEPSSPPPGPPTSPLDVLDLLLRLVDKSLVEVEERDGAARYRLLESVRQYAWAQVRTVGEEAPTRDRHRDWCLALAEQAAPELHGPEVGRWLARLETEHDNLRAALAWSLAAPDGAEAGLRLAGALGWFWFVRDYLSEGRAWLERALNRGGAGVARAVAGGRAGLLAWHLGDYEWGTARLEESLALGRALGDRRVTAYALGILGLIASGRGDEPAARAHLADGVAVARAAGDRLALATALFFYGAYAPHAELADARAALEESLALCRAVGDPVYTALVLGNLGMVATGQGELGAARAFLEESLALQRALGMTNRMAMSFSRLGRVARLEGDYAAARALYTASLTAVKDVGDRTLLAQLLVGLGGLAVAQGQAARAARLFGAAAAVRAAIGNVVPRSLRGEYERDVAAARATLGEAAFTAAWAAGQSLSLAEAIAEALADAPEATAATIGRPPPADGLTLHEVEAPR